MCGLTNSIIFALYFTACKFIEFLRSTNNVTILSYLIYIKMGNCPLVTEELNPFLYICCQVNKESWNGILIFGTPWNPQIVVTVSFLYFSQTRKRDISYLIEGQMIIDESKNIGNGWIPLHDVASKLRLAIHGPGRQTLAIFLAPTFFSSIVLGQLSYCPHW